MALFERNIYQDLKYLSYATILFISALKGQRVDKVLDMVDRLAEQTKKRVPTGLLNRNFGQWVEEMSPPLYKNRRVKLNYITQVSTGPPLCDLHGSSGASISYERHLVNRIRRRLALKRFRLSPTRKKKGIMKSRRLKKYLFAFICLLLLRGGFSVRDDRAKDRTTILEW
jgi:predicted GTPase